VSETGYRTLANTCLGPDIELKDKKDKAQSSRGAEKATQLTRRKQTNKR
jgi:hypothetical protein